MYSHHPKIAARWQEQTPPNAKLPDHKGGAYARHAARTKDKDHG